MGRPGKRTVEETTANKAAFLEVYKTSFGKQHALSKIGISSLNTFRNWMKTDTEFAQAFEEAKDVCIDNAEHTLYSAAMGNIELNKNQFLPLAMFLKGNLGEKYNDRASYELIHTTHKENAKQLYKELIAELNKPDTELSVREALPPGDIQ